MSEMFANLDENADGKIDRHEFCRGYDQLQRELHKINDAKVAPMVTV